MNRARAISWCVLALAGIVPAGAAAEPATSAPATGAASAAATGAAPIPAPPPAEHAAAVPADRAPAEEREEREEQALILPAGVRLGGLFDAVYEREGRSGELGSGRNALRSYHRFLFLTRQGNDVPIGFNAELLGLHFYELTMRLHRGPARWRVTAHAGKILVPFGPDPLFHKSYGGLSGADQPLLPVVWSSLGGGLRVSRTWGGLSLADEAYVVQGFDLPARDDMLNLQRDLLAYDGARVAVGNRLAASYGPVSLYYSFFWNPMRFGRQLIMQALDLTLWRPRWPVLRHFALGMGAVRAFVSADESAGRADAVPGAASYFHFADYVWLRAYGPDWLYLQARSGLATFGNRRGTFYDGSRATASDGSHHNLALVAEHAGAMVSLAYFWNFEKIDERADDRLRLTVTYAF
jgi:hypothetical protein